jgi:hypothetical protein
MSGRDAARLYGAARAVIGGALVVAPGAVGSVWLGDLARTAPGAANLRALGARDTLLGVALLRGRGEADAGLLWLCAAADAADLVATVAHRRALPRVGWALVGAMAAGGAAAGAVTGAALTGRLSPFVRSPGPSAARGSR